MKLTTSLTADKHCFVSLPANSFEEFKQSTGGTVSLSFLLVPGSRFAVVQVARWCSRSVGR